MTMERPDGATIDPVKLDDIPAIQNIARKTWQVTYAGLIPDHVQEQLLDWWYSTAALEGAIRARPTIFLIARVRERPVAFAQFATISPAAAMLSRIYVLPEYQNLRIGTLLLEIASNELKTLGIEKVLVDVERDNPVGRRFYRRKSFREVGESTADLAGQAVPLIRCELALSAATEG
jgi:ribosomal protein S18 acetylase RimI-like enzyme